MIVKHGFSKFVAVILILETMPVLLLADSRYDALNLENTGDYAGAQKLYIQWLDKNPGHKQFTEVLLHTVSIATYTDDAINLLRFHLKQAPDVDKARLYSRLAWLESATGNPLSAAEYYKQAGKRSVGVKADEYKLDALALYFSMGENEIVTGEAGKIVREGYTQTVRERAVAMASLSLAFSAPARSLEMAYTQINSFIQRIRSPVTPWPWLAFREIAGMNNKNLSVREAEKNIAKYFPESAADYLVKGNIREWFSPRKFFSFHSGSPKKTNRGKNLQLAAFSSRNRAEEYLSSLKKQDIEAWIENEGEIWRVIRSQP